MTAETRIAAAKAIQGKVEELVSELEILRRNIPPGAPSNVHLVKAGAELVQATAQLETYIAKVTSR